MLSKTTLKHKQYSCRVCQKVDRKTRMVGHILEHHIPLDRAPFACSLCNFRCMDKPTLLSHVTQYQRHRSEVSRLGISDQSVVLRQSSNPIDPNTLIQEVDDVQVMPEMSGRSNCGGANGENPLLPDWLESVIETPKPPKGPHQSSTIATCAGDAHHLYPTSFSPLVAYPVVSPQPTNLCASVSDKIMFPETTIGKVMPINIPAAQPSLQAPPITGKLVRCPAVPVASPLGLDLPFSGISCPPTKIFTTVATQPTLTSCALSMPSLESLLATPKAQMANHLRTPLKVGIESSEDTPLQDEGVFVFDGRFDKSIENDPLYIEGLKTIPSTKAKETVTEKKATSTQTVQPETTSRTDDLLQKILEAIERNGRELKNLQRRVTVTNEEVRSVKRAIVTLERTMAKKQTVLAPRGSATPLFKSPYNKRRTLPSASPSPKKKLENLEMENGSQNDVESTQYKIMNSHSLFDEEDDPMEDDFNPSLGYTMYRKK